MPTLIMILGIIGTQTGKADTSKSGSGYTYDADGNRLSKTANGKTTNGKTTLYHYFQGQLMYETVDSTITALCLRSSDGKLLGVRLNQNGVNNYYSYHYDTQGDVTAVTDANGAVYRQYVYDPYGNIISVKDDSVNSINIGNDPGFNNAYTYRGYRFDSETGLYFLQKLEKQGFKKCKTSVKIKKKIQIGNGILLNCYLKVLYQVNQIKIK
ncbi:hypothetical protein REC12_19920 [Desulfosporosinus sp. PR]|uniref:RHS repeat domain-containing protein n=1 Tax=Candidatus Desulfosporosinus nitrosoreducens TaxID=3401928 RepID=UPI0027F72E83|nr:hypothetical protein [Desulfosporosinus sp. PR]MDQ7095865.1 hypothetical protein [Desulfosporosinus sp. PR]